MKILIIISIFIFFSEASMATADQGTRWEQLFQLVNEEIKTVEAVAGNRGSDLEYRLFQLHSERLGLIKEKENYIFLSASPLDRSKKSKESYFVESLQIYQQIKARGLKIIKDYPKHREMGSIYFTLATNSRDYGKDKMTEYFFQKALQFVSPTSKIAHSIRVGLAEYYYNEKDYNKATITYRDVVANEQDEWLAKHYFNLAWCNLKIKHFDTAINNLIVAFNLGKPKVNAKVSYISVSEQVLTAMSIFYVLANRGSEGVQFFIKEVPAPTPYLLKLAHSAAENGQFKEARLALTEALKKERDPTNLAQIRLKELDIYRNFKQEDLFFAAAEAFWKLNQSASIKKEFKDEFVDKAKSLAGQYQMELSKRFNHDKVINETQLSRVLDYFKMIADVSQNEASVYAYYSGETLFILKRFAHSAQYYEKAIRYQKENSPDLVLLKKVLNSFFAAISDDNFPKSEWRKMAFLGYEKLLYFYPHDEKAPWAYQELFALYVQDKRVLEAEKLLNAYQLNFAKDLDTQKKQFLSLLDYYIKSKNIIEINRLIALMPKPPFLFAVDETEKAMGILGNILFEQFTSLEKQNKIEEASKGLNELVAQEIFPAVVRAKAAYNASLIYLSRMEGEQATEMALTALKLMPEKEYREYLPKFQKMTFLLAYGQFLNEAIILGTKISKIVAKNQSFPETQKELTLGMIEWNLSLHRFSEAEALATFEYNEKANLLITNTYQYLNYSVEYLKFVKKLVLLKSLTQMKQKKDILDHILNIYLENFPEKTSTGALALSTLEECLSDLSSSPSAEIVSPYREALALQVKFEKIYSTLKVPFTLDVAKYLVPFNQELFNRSLSEALGRLQSLTSEIDEFLKKSNPHYALYLSYQLSNIYLENASKLAMLNPSESPAEFQLAFQKEMKNLSHMIEEKGQSYFKLFKKMQVSGFDSGNLNVAIYDRVNLPAAAQPRTPASSIKELTILVD